MSVGHIFGIFKYLIKLLKISVLLFLLLIETLSIYHTETLAVYQDKLIQALNWVSKTLLL
jgi:hypothetical protein